MLKNNTVCLQKVIFLHIRLKTYQSPLVQTEYFTKQNA